jgi:23S rRNA (adenine2503-C2)-methyltransferase
MIPSMSTPPIDLYNQSPEELQALFEGWGEKKFRAQQLYRQLYVKQAEAIDGMSDLSKPLREKLAGKTVLGSLKLLQVQNGDGGLTRKALFKLNEEATIETVLMVYPDRATVCVSSQAGCPMGCTFCATAKLGFLHDLTPGQMVQQVLWASNELSRMEADYEAAGGNRHRVTRENFPRRLSNVVFMGMGEPFNNYDSWYRSVERLHDPKGYNMGARSFTVSTVGLIPGIDQLAEEELPVNLAISLHASDDAVRGAMMPVNRRYPIAELLDSVVRYTKKTGRRVSFEYVLIQDKNDTPEEAERLAELLLRDGDKILCHVNLIPWNPIPGAEMKRSGRENINAFRDILTERGITCTIRIHRGMDIDAACGQLAGSAKSSESESE